MKKNLYSRLGVDKKASAKEIKEAYKNKAKHHHPDKVTGNNEQMVEINHAYQVLINPLKRKRYDELGDDAPEKPFEIRFHSLMNTFFIRIINQINNVEREDVIGHLLTNLTLNLNALNEKMKEFIETNSKYVKTQRRITSNSNTTLFNILEQHIEITENNIAQIKEEIKFLEECIKRVEEYEYEFDKPKSIGRQSGLSNWALTTNFL